MYHCYPFPEVARVHVVVAGKNRDWAGAYSSPDLAFVVSVT